MQVLVAEEGILQVGQVDTVTTFCELFERALNDLNAAVGNRVLKTKC